jgi:transposase
LCWFAARPVLEIRGVDARLAVIAKRMSAILAEHGSRLPDVAGIGPVLAARIVGRTGQPTHFPSAASFASYAGVRCCCSTARWQPTSTRKSCASSGQPGRG